jgi:hypothetical protein
VAPSPGAYVTIYESELSTEGELTTSPLNVAFATERTELLESLLVFATPSPTIIVPPAPQIEVQPSCAPPSCRRRLSFELIVAAAQDEVSFFSILGA